MDPGRESRFAAKALAVPDYLFEGSLHGVSRGLGIARDLKRDGLQTRLQAVEQCAKLFAVRQGPVPSDRLRSSRAVFVDRLALLC
jgi:hypothetical protein